MAWIVVLLVELKLLAQPFMKIYDASRFTEKLFDRVAVTTKAENDF
jgi:hypothetical protein